MRKGHAPATLEAAGVKLFIGAAGLAAHLPGVLASLTARPVIGIPLDGGSLGGADALYAVVQMPPGVPVATVAIGSAGAKNAALPLMTASLLTGETLELRNVPRLADVNLLLRILGNHGVDHTITPMMSTSSIHFV